MFGVASINMSRSTTERDTIHNYFVVLIVDSEAVIFVAAVVVNMSSKLKIPLMFPNGTKKKIRL